MAKYKLTKDGVQNTETTAFIPNDIRNNDWREYQNWLKGLDVEGEDLGTGENTPDPQDPPVQLVVDENEEKIQAEIRRMAVENLKTSGGLPPDYKG